MTIKHSADMTALVDREAAKVRDDLDAVGLLGFLRDNPRAAKFALVVTADCLRKFRDPHEMELRLWGYDQLCSQILEQP